MTVTISSPQEQLVEKAYQYAVSFVAQSTFASPEERDARVEQLAKQLVDKSMAYYDTCNAETVFTSSDSLFRRYLRGAPSSRHQGKDGC